MRIRAFLAAILGLSFLVPSPLTAQSGARVQLAQADKKGDEDSDRKDRRNQNRDEKRGKSEDRGSERSRDRDSDRGSDRGKDAGRDAGKSDNSRREDEAKARSEAEAKAKAAREAESRSKTERESKSRSEAEAKAKAEREADARSKAERESKSRSEAEAKAKAERDADARSKAERESKSRSDAEAKAKAAREAEAKAKADAEAKDRTRRQDQSEPQRRQTEDRDRDDRRERSSRERRRDSEEEREARERAQRREQQRTPAQELTRVRVEQGRSTQIDGGRRRLERDGDRVIIRSDETNRFVVRGDRRGNERTERLPNGHTRTIVVYPDGTQIITIIDARGRTVHRSRRGRDGREIVFFREVQRPPLVAIDLGPLRVTIPREQYIVDSRRASPADYRRVLWAPPVERVDRVYTIDEVRQFERVRNIMPRLDFHAINFDSDSAIISQEQIDLLGDLADIIHEMIQKNPAEVVMIEGHTDLVGSDVYNLALSDRRAEAVAIALTDYFNVPPENLVTQGYGESFPIVQTEEPERENRRVAFRRVTPLVSEYGR